MAFSLRVSDDQVTDKATLEKDRVIFSSGDLVFPLVVRKESRSLLGAQVA